MSFEGLNYVAGEVVWKLSDPPEGLSEKSRSIVRRVISLVEEKGIPQAPKLVPFEHNGCVRPSGHRRAYYIELEEGGYLGVKGTECTMPALGEFFNSRLPLEWVGEKAGIDHFPIVEHKLPMVLSTREALDESSTAQEIFTAFLQRYGREPRIPMPVIVVRWPNEVVEEYKRNLFPLLSPFALEICSRLLTDGLSTYLYYYPEPPFPRVRHLAGIHNGSPASRREPLGELSEVRETIDGWIQLFYDLLLLGYLPATSSQAVTGQSVQAQNAVVGGGFVDVDSIRKMSTIDSDRDFYESYNFGLVRLAATIACYLFDGSSEHAGFSDPLRAQESASLLYLVDSLRKLWEQDAARGDSALDPRLALLPPFNRSPISLLELATSYQKFPRPGTLTVALEKGPDADDD